APAAVLVNTVGRSSRPRAAASVLPLQATTRSPSAPVASVQSASAGGVKTIRLPHKAVALRSGRRRVMIAYPALRRLPVEDVQNSRRGGPRPRGPDLSAAHGRGGLVGLARRGVLRTEEAMRVFRRQSRSARQADRRRPM